MDQLEEDIKSEVRKDQLLAFYKKNKKLLSNVAFFVCLAIAGYFFYQTRQSEARVDASKSLYTAMMQKDDTAALKSLESIAKKSGYAYADLAKLYGAHIFEKMDNYEDAAYALQMAIKETSEPELKAIARLRLARLNIDFGKNPEETSKILSDFKKESPWYLLAKEFERFSVKTCVNVSFDL